MRSEGKPVIEPTIIEKGKPLPNEMKVTDKCTFSSRHHQKITCKKLLRIGSV
jgi:hypothetical protein